MADEEIKKDEPKEKEPTFGNKKNFVGWIITFTVAIICAAGGYGLSGLFAKTESAKNEATEEIEKAPEAEYMSLKPENPWIFELESNTANLNEPGSTRMIRVSVVMELSEKMDEELGKVFLESKKVYLKDWMMTYLAGLNLQQVSGSSSQSRMKVEIKESFNEILFPDTEPLVTRVMLKDYTIQ